MATLTCLAVGLVLGLMTAYVIDAHDRVTHLENQVCNYQQVAIQIIAELEVKNNMQLPQIKPESCK